MKLLLGLLIAFYINTIVNIGHFMAIDGGVKEKIEIFTKIKNAINGYAVAIPVTGRCKTEEQIQYYECTETMVSLSKWLYEE